MKLDNKKCAEFAQALRHAWHLRRKTGRKVQVFYEGGAQNCRVRFWKNGPMSRFNYYDFTCNAKVFVKKCNSEEGLLCMFRGCALFETSLEYT